MRRSVNPFPLPSTATPAVSRRARTATAHGAGVMPAEGLSRRRRPVPADPPGSRPATSYVSVLGMKTQRTTTMTVGTSPTALPSIAGAASSQQSLAGRTSLAIQNRGAVSIWLGGPAVAVGYGWEVAPDTSDSFDLGESALLYAIASADCTVTVMEGAG